MVRDYSKVITISKSGREYSEDDANGKRSKILFLESTYYYVSLSNKAISHLHKNDYST